MTLPQALFMWVRGQELVGRDRRVMAYTTLVATMTALGTDKSNKLFSSLMHQLEGTHPDDYWQTASEASLKVMLGSRYAGREGGE